MGVMQVVQNRSKYFTVILLIMSEIEILATLGQNLYAVAATMTPFSLLV